MAETANQFGQFNLKPEIIIALTKIGFTKPTPVQAKLIPAILQGKDVVGQSQTGSGKTHTFLIPIFNQLEQTANTYRQLLQRRHVNWLLKLQKRPRILRHSSIPILQVLNMLVGRISSVKSSSWKTTNHKLLSGHLAELKIWLNRVL